MRFIKASWNFSILGGGGTSRFGQILEEGHQNVFLLKPKIVYPQ